MKNKLILLAILVSVTLSACHDTKLYRGEFPELHIIAVESVIGAGNNEMNRVLVIEEDNFGRKLFAFMGYSQTELNMDNPSIIAILISQKDDGKYTYFYDTVNYLATTIDSEYLDFDVEKVNTYFSNNDIEKLKSINDWNKPIDESELFRVEITRKKVCNVKAQDIRKHQDLFSEELNYNSIHCYSTDRNGLTLISILTMMTPVTSGHYKILLLILNKNEELVSNDAFMEVTNQLNLSDLYLFKLKHGWSFAY